MSTVPTPLVPQQFSTVLQALTLQMLGVAQPYTAAEYSLVRIAWPVQGQPFPKDPTKDICILRVIEEEGLYNKVRDRLQVTNNGETNYQQDCYTRIWRVFWVLYGPNAFDRARQIRSGLFSDGIRIALAGINVYAVPGYTAPLRVPEVINNETWERVDFWALMNEQVTEQITVATVESLEVIVNNDASSIAGVPLADITIES